jgi:hypothetical protein
MELVSLYEGVRQTAGTGASTWPFLPSPDDRRVWTIGEMVPDISKPMCSTEALPLSLC